MLSCSLGLLCYYFARVALTKTTIKLKGLKRRYQTRQVCEEAHKFYLCASSQTCYFCYIFSKATAKWFIDSIRCETRKQQIYWESKRTAIKVSFHQTLKTRRWALTTFLQYLTDRIMRLSANSWWSWHIRVDVISVQTYLLTLCVGYIPCAAKF